MKSFICLILFLTLALEYASARPQFIPIVDYKFNFIPGESYNYLYETGDKIKKEETGVLPKVDTESITVKGLYSYVDPEGVFNKVSYVADEEGFRSNVQLNAKP